MARSASGPFFLTLYRPGTPDETNAARVIAERVLARGAEVRPAFDSLVDIAWIDARERAA